MRSLAVLQFKARCIAELKALQNNGEELEITLRGKPIGRIIPVTSGGRRLGTVSGLMEIHADLLLASDLDKDFGDAEFKRIAKLSPKPRSRK